MPLTPARLSRSLLSEARSSRLPTPTLIHLTSPTRRFKNADLDTFRPFTTTTTTTMAPTTPSAPSASLTKHTPIVISGPSGAGKSTILKRLFDEYPDRFGFSISHTTRSPRGTEKDGVEYYFVSKDAFLRLVEEKGFVEHAQFGGNHYGTSVQAVNDIAEKGRVCILDIEMEGVKQVANHPTFPRPRFLFLQPPSMEVLEQRLRSRATDTEEAILKRLNQARVEMEFAHSGQAPHDKIVVNDDLETAYQEAKQFVVGNEA
ncbi:guanylate kinase [Decorospora gaudefroyi]|uniref:Guanylate kinase n=1 Tax=Decorospora gaudefroyi TaxID=184978 RepID=A0A6A5KH77_9PLEO|nr:guanylate kinase [Decorospora gaudefroyi]